MLPRLIFLPTIIVFAFPSLILAQTTVPHTDTTWQDFGTTDVVAVAGNFLPGWETTQGTPDLGDDLFFFPTDSLSEDDDDAGLWVLRVTAGPTPNEAARLSLSGFSPGTNYEMDFHTTLVRLDSFQWKGNNVPLDVSVTGASLASYATSSMVDPIEADGLNNWSMQTIAFQALSSEVTFEFNGLPTTPSPLGDVSRIGIDGFSAIRVSSIPEPTSAAIVWLVLTATLFKQRLRG